MKTYIFILVNFVLRSAFPLNNSIPEIVVSYLDMGEDKHIADINKGILKDDILKLDTQRSAVSDTQLYWSIPVPYVLQKNLDMNAKGVILRAFDQFRLKSCIEFALRTSEKFYLSFKKDYGCYSYIGRVKLKGQDISIGQYCDDISTVEHEVMHALGFLHEHSRHDRDEYVTINHENVIEGYEINFAKATEEESITHGVPYDYWSVMHYHAYVFSNGNGPTMVPLANDSKFLTIIGQQLDMSPSDVLELNRLYKCNSTIAFKMHCNFSDATICEMTHCSQTNNSWTRIKSATGGPNCDHTSLPTDSQATREHPGYFMHVSTASGQEGDSARLETKRMRLNRDCHIQCLQFFYFHSGSSSDVLNIWLREFHNEMDGTGQRRLMGQITGPPTSYWQVHHVSLNASTFFQVEFEVYKGTGNSSGGISIDDINLSEVECPHVTIQIDDFRHVLNTSSFGSIIYSPRQYSTTGYSYRVGVELFQTYAGVFVQMMSSENDEHLEWPVHNKMVTFTCFDQEPNIYQRMSKERSFTADRSFTLSGVTLWDNPRKFGLSFVDENNQTVYVGPRISIHTFVHFPLLTFRNFLKGNSTVFTYTFYDLTPLVNGNELPCPVSKAGKITHPPTDQDQGPCLVRIPTTEAPVTSNDLSVFGNFPGKVSFSIHVLILLSALLLLIP